MNGRVALLPLANGDVSLNTIDGSDLDVEVFRVGSGDLGGFCLEVVRPLVDRLLLYSPTEETT
jgi:hypothetical protein